jgi:HSP90 family molecular chaperone
MARDDEFPWWQEGQTPTEREVEEWIAQHYGVEPLVTFPLYKRCSGDISVTVLLFAPADRDASSAAREHVDLYLNGVLVGKRLAGFLPQYYDFAVGVVGASWPGPPKSADEVVTRLASITKEGLEESVLSCLSQLLAENERGRTARILFDTYGAQLRYAASASSAFRETLADYISVSSSDGHRLLRRLLELVNVSPGQKERFLAVAVFVDPKRWPYSEIFERRGLKVIDARDASVFMLVKQFAEENGLAVSQVDRLEEDSLMLVEADIASDRGWQPLIEQFRQATYPAKVRIVALDWLDAPAVFLPGEDVDEDNALTNVLHDIVRHGGEKRFTELRLRDFYREHTDISKWTLIINAEHKLAKKLKAFEPNGLAASFAPRLVHHAAYMNAAERVERERQEQAWSDVEQLLENADRLEKEIERLRRRIKELEEELAHRTGMYYGLKTSSEEQVRGLIQENVELTLEIQELKRKLEEKEQELQKKKEELERSGILNPRLSKSK